MANITLFRTKTCQWCHKTAEFLKEHNIEYNEKDVSTDPEARNEMIEKSGQMGVPVLDIDGKIIVGYDEGEIKKELHIK